MMSATGLLGDPLMFTGLDRLTPPKHWKRLNHVRGCLQWSRGQWVLTAPIAGGLAILEEFGEERGRLTVEAPDSESEVRGLLTWANAIVEPEPAEPEPVEEPEPAAAAKASELEFAAKSIVDKWQHAWSNADVTSLAEVFSIADFHRLERALAGDVDMIDDSAATVPEPGVVLPADVVSKTVLLLRYAANMASDGGHTASESELRAMGETLNRAYLDWANEGDEQYERENATAEAEPAHELIAILRHQQDATERAIQCVEHWAVAEALQGPMNCLSGPDRLAVNVARNWLISGSRELSRLCNPTRRESIPVAMRKRVAMLAHDMKRSARRLLYVGEHA